MKSLAKLALVLLAVGPAISGGQAALLGDEAADGRRPLPLLQMMADHQKSLMRDHLSAVQEIVTALASDDFAAVERAASRLGYTEEVGRMCRHLGTASPAFTQQALAFHHTADGVAAAARAQSRQRVLAELSTTLQACRACHAKWKQEVVDESTWSRMSLHE
jgi:cytochrome c556